MQTTVVDIEHLAKIRRLEALSARAWPAEDVFYDRAWQVGNYRVKFPILGSVDIAIITPLDASDNVNIAQRLEELKVKLDRKIYWKITPLAAKEIVEQFDLASIGCVLQNKIFIASSKDLNIEPSVELCPLTVDEYAESFGRFSDVVSPEFGSLGKVKGKACYFSTCDGAYGARYILDNGFAYIDRWPNQDNLALTFMEALIAQAIKDGALYIWYRSPAHLVEPHFNAELLYSEAYYEA